MGKRRTPPSAARRDQLVRWGRRAVIALAAVAIAIPVFLVGVHPRGGQSGTLVVTDATGRSQTVAEWRTGTKGGRAISVEPGEVEINVSNADQQVHDLIVVRAAPDPVPLTQPDGTVNLSSLGTVITAIGGFGPGDSRRETITLEPGEYVILCNLPGHYEAGMYYRVEVGG